MSRLRVLVLMHEDLVPPGDLSDLTPKEIAPIKTEYDVCHALQDELGHTVEMLGLRDELAPLRRVIRDWKPHVAFNLLEEFHGEAIYDHNVVGYLELMRVAYTGCNPRGLILSRDKGLSKKILHYHRIRVPEFAVFPLGRRVKRPKRLEYPVIVKSLIDDASLGISQASIVNNDEKLAERVRFIHEKYASDAIAEQFVPGREVYVSVLGNHRLKVLPIWELDLGGLPDDAARIATEKVKFDLEYQDKHDIKIGPAKGLGDELEAKLARTSKRIYRVLGLSGYARIDFRIDAEGRAWFLEANPNPDIAADEEFASSARAAGFGYSKLIQKLISLGRNRAKG